MYGEITLVHFTPDPSATGLGKKIRSGAPPGKQIYSMTALVFENRKPPLFASLRNPNKRGFLLATTILQYCSIVVAIRANWASNFQQIKTRYKKFTAVSPGLILNSKTLKPMSDFFEQVEVLSLYK